MIFVLLVVLTVLGGAAVVGMAVNDRKRKALPGGGSQKALPAASGNGDVLAERSIRDLRVGDVLTMDGNDFLVEGVLNYDEDGHRWVGARIVDGSDERWMVVGLERSGITAARMLTIDNNIAITGYPAETIIVAETKFNLDKRGTATVKLSGELGPLGDLRKDRPEKHAERCRWWLYNSGGDETIIVEQFGSDYRALRGTKISTATIDLIPGS